jgi:rhamnose utilization protein RhaD (predicted bifunctional aldolase and dehydrogenase)/NAD(P)-dependent dehydrogenase (short-subunit alcohol dehydrogenase family)
MKSLWNDADASAFAGDDLAMRVYTSRLLGASEDLVMHGGGNTSVKGITSDFFGNEVEVLYVKGSGWDLKTIEKPGFPAIRLKETCLLAELDALSDTDMTQQLRALMLDPSAPSPSVEAILHAIMPARFIDHTHTDAIITLTNNPKGDDIVPELFPDCLVLPYTMPGFILSKQVNDALKKVDLGKLKGIILMHHGVFTFSEDAREAYENMIELVTRAEEYIASNGLDKHTETSHPVNLTTLAQIRRAVSEARGAPQLAVLDSSGDAQGYASRQDVSEIASRGPITPDHVIRTKRVPIILDPQPQVGIPEVATYAEEYRAYFQRNGSDALTMLDPAPRFGIWRDTGSIAFGNSLKECRIISDIARHTRWAIQTGETVGGWEALPEKDIFDLEYWVLEQAKLGKSSGPGKPHQGKVAIVTGANSGIGKATSEALSADGAVVVGLDINPGVVEQLNRDGLTGIMCDLTNTESITEAVNQVVARYGGLDIVVCNAGIFKSGEQIESHSEATWDQTMAVNLTATQRFLTATIPYLKLGVNPSILVVGSRNFSAPGAGAAAYSVSKAGITQLARVAALELAADGVRVNVVHPDAVFDTAIWTEEALTKSAARYSMSVEEYKSKNLLGKEISSGDVARLLSVLASDAFSATTGAQIPIDGGNDRVI